MGGTIGDAVVQAVVVVGNRLEQEAGVDLDVGNRLAELVEVVVAGAGVAPGRRGSQAVGRPPAPGAGVRAGWRNVSVTTYMVGTPPEGAVSPQGRTSLMKL